MRLSHSLGLGVLIALVATFGTFRMAAGDPPKVVPDFTYKDLSGKDVNFYSLHDKAYVIDLWATYCVPCKKEISDLNLFQHKYQAQGLKVIGISMDDDGAKVVPPYVARNPIEYTVLIGDLDSIAHVVGDIATLPDTYFVDGEHRLRSVVLEYHSGEELEQHIKELLASK